MLSLRRLLPLTAAALACSAAPALAGPVNDDFASATPLSSSGQQGFFANTTGAGSEAGEPDHWGQGTSVWFRWTPAQTGGTYLSACGSGLRIAVYSGTSVSNLVDESGGGAKCKGDAIVEAVAGTTYRIAVDADTTPGASGTVTLKQVTTLPNMALGAPLTKVGMSGEVPIVETTGAEGLYFVKCEIVGKPAQSGQCFQRSGGWVFRWQGLPTGTHTMRVAVRDWLFNADPTPLQQTFTVDSDPPETTFTSAPPAPTATTATFTFASSEPGSTFQCSFDGVLPYVPCSSPYSVPVTSLGGHVLHVRAFDAYGNGDVTPAHITWMRQDPKPAVVPPKSVPTTTAQTGTTGTAPSTVRAVTTTSAAIPAPCRPVLRLPASATRTTLRRGVRVTVTTGARCSISASLSRGTTAYARWTGLTSVTRTVKLSRTAVRRLRTGSRILLDVRASGPAGAVRVSARLRVRG